MRRKITNNFSHGNYVLCFSSPDNSARFLLILYALIKSEMKTWDETFIFFNIIFIFGAELYKVYYSNDHGLISY